MDLYDDKTLSQKMPQKCFQKYFWIPIILGFKIQQTKHL